MKKSNIFRVLLGDRSISYHPVTARIMGSAAGGVWLCQLLYWDARKAENDPDFDGWFYKSRPEIMQETGLSDRECRDAKARALELKIVESELRGFPKVSHYRFNFDLLEAHIFQFQSVQGVPTGSGPSRYGVDQTVGTASTRQSVQVHAQIRPQSTQESTQESTISTPALGGLDSRDSSDSEDSGGTAPPAQATSIAVGEKDRSAYVWIKFGKDFKCECPARTRVLWQRGLTRTPCCGREIVTKFIAPRTPLAELLFRKHDHWLGFKDKEERAAWEQAEFDQPDLLAQKIDWAINIAGIGRGSVVRNILTAVQSSAPPTPKPIAESAAPDVVSQMNMQAVLANASRRQKEKVEGKD